MTSHYTRGSVTTLHDFGGVLGVPLDNLFWPLTITRSRLLARVWSGRSRNTKRSQNTCDRMDLGTLGFHLTDRIATQKCPRRTLVRGRSHRAVPTPSIDICGCNSEKSGGPCHLFLNIIPSDFMATTERKVGVIGAWESPCRFFRILDTYERSLLGPFMLVKVSGICVTVTTL